MDQDATWQGGRPRPRRHCVRWRPSSPKSGYSPHPLFDHVYCSQTAGWIRMPLGAEVGLVPGDIMLDENQAPPPKRGTAPNFRPCLLWPNSWMDQDGTWYGGRPRPRQHCVRWRPSSPPSLQKGHSLQFSAHVYCGQTAGWIKMELGTEVGLGPGHTVLDGDPAPPKRDTVPNFRPMSVVAKRSPISATAEHLL